MKAVLLNSWNLTEVLFSPQGAECADQFEVCPYLFPWSWTWLCAVGFQSLWISAPHSSTGAKRSRSRLLYCQVPKSWRRRVCAGILIFFFPSSTDFCGEKQTEEENRENLLTAVLIQWAIHGGFFFHWLLGVNRKAVGLFTLMFGVFFLPPPSPTRSCHWGLQRKKMQE